MLMSLKDKILNVITAHPKLVIFGIGLGITFVIGTAIGMVNNNQVFAYLPTDHSQPGGPD
jgi:hypothetical protein